MGLRQHFCECQPHPTGSFYMGGKAGTWDPEKSSVPSSLTPGQRDETLRLCGHDQRVTSGPISRCGTTPRAKANRAGRQAATSIQADFRRRQSSTLKTKRNGLSSAYISR